jgi:membrane-associated phospholipid phosphatase
MSIDVVTFIQSLRSDVLDVFFNLISFMGEETIYIVVLAIVYFGVSQKKGEFLAAILFFTGVFNTFLKGVFLAQRPFEKYPNLVENLRPETAGGHSFPSGHTQNFTAFLVSGALLLKQKKFLVIAGILSILMAISRMYLGVHFLEDVLVSLILGTLTGYIGYHYYHTYYEKRHIFYVAVGIIGLLLIVFVQTESYLKALGYYLGFVLAMQFNKQVVKYTFSPNIKKRIIRVLLGLMLIVILQLGFGALGIENFYLKMIRNAVIVFTGFGLYPLLIKKMAY